MLTNYTGIHAWDIPPHDPEPGRLWDFIIQVIYNPILALVKSSVLLFLLRLGGTKTRVRWSIHVLNAVNIGLMIAIFFVVIFTCKPVSFYWDKSVDGACIDSSPFNIGTAIITICTDVLVLAIPVWILVDLKMPLRIKLVLLGVFLLGFMCAVFVLGSFRPVAKADNLHRVTIVGAIRLWLLYGYLRSRASGFTSPDPTFNLGFTSSCIEGNLAIITASIPALWPLGRLWFPNFFARIGAAYPRGHSKSTSSKGTRSGGSGRDKRVVTIGGSSQHYHSDGSSFIMKPVRGYGHTEIRSSTPEGSEEEIMAYNGIVRTMTVQVKSDDGPLSRYSPYMPYGEDQIPEKGRGA